MGESHTDKLSVSSPNSLHNPAPVQLWQGVGNFFGEHTESSQTSFRRAPVVWETSVSSACWNEWLTCNLSVHTPALIRDFEFLWFIEGVCVYNDGLMRRMTHYLPETYSYTSSSIQNSIPARLWQCALKFLGKCKDAPRIWFHIDFCYQVSVCI